MKQYGKPVDCNEDDKVRQEGAVALALSVTNGCGWGYMDSRRNQYLPFEFLGTEDDPEVYKIMKDLTMPGFKIDPESLKHTSIMITYPNDGDVFPAERNITPVLSHLYPDPSIPYTLEILANGRYIGSAA